jgi:hypothetical protein
MRRHVFSCVSGNELNPSEGTECEHTLISTIGYQKKEAARDKN